MWPEDYVSTFGTPSGRDNGGLSKQSLSGLLFNIKRYKWEGAGVYCVGWGLE